MQGFPWDGKFETKQEIYNYFSSDRVQCLLCGKWFKRLPAHLKRIHDIGSDEYKGIYGLPWKRGLCGKGISLKYRKIMKKRIKDGFNPTPDVASRKKSKEAYRRKDQSFFTRLKI